MAAYLVKRAHGGGCWRYHIADEKEESVFGTQMNTFADQEIELANGQIRRYQVLLFVQIANVCFGRLLDNYLCAKSGQFCLENWWWWNKWTLIINSISTLRIWPYFLCQKNTSLYLHVHILRITSVHKFVFIWRTRMYYFYQN